MVRGRAAASSAHKAAVARMRRAAEQLRTGQVGDQPGAREAAARLLEHLADRDDLNIHLFDRAAGLADRVLARDPHHAMDDVKPLAQGWSRDAPPRQL